MTTTPRVGLIHATPIAIPPVRVAFAQRWPEAEVLDLLDQGLLAVLAPDGSLGPRATDRMLRVVALVRDADARVIQLTCSAYSPLVPVLRRVAPVPILAIDDALMEAAVERGRRIALISTGALAETSLRAAAARAGRAIELDAIVYREAAAALDRGDGTRTELRWTGRALAFRQLRGVHGHAETVPSPNVDLGDSGKNGETRF